METANNSMLSKVFGVLSSNWAVIIFLVLTIFSVMKIIDSQESTIKALETAQGVYAANYESLKKDMVDIRQQVLENSVKMTDHYNRINRNVNEASAKLSRLEKALMKENVASAKPGLVTKKVQAAIDENEERLACITGNTQYCQ